jgi:hypothetical protein
LGSCPASTPIACGNYACGETACLDECHSNVDCVGSSYCDGRHCIAGVRCSADNKEAINEAGDHEDCFPYVCDGGRCPKSCTDISQCAEGNLYCNTTTGKCEEPKAAVMASTKRRRSSGCSLSGHHAALRVTVPWCLLLLLLARRRARDATN